MTREARAETTRSPQVLRGMRDFLPQQMLLRQEIVDRFKAVFERFGFEPIDTPLLEYYEVLAGKYGEEGEKLMYHFQDHGGREVGLRYDLTVPLARFVAAHRHELTFPFKRYHIGPVFRAERPQRGRYRQFWQCDVDTVGTRSMLADAEVLLVWIEALASVNIPNVVVQVNHRKLLQALASHAGVPAEQALTVYRAIDKLEKIGPEGVREELLRHGVSEPAAQGVLGLVQLRGEPGPVLAEVRQRLAGDPQAMEAVAELEELFRYLGLLGADPRRYALNLALARGLDYYTGPVFEAVVEEPAIGSLGGAGRYDGLIGMFLGEDIPATGGSLGLERVVEVVQELQLLHAPSTVTQALVTVFDDESWGVALGLVQELRAGGVAAEVYLGERRDLRRQVQYADRKGVPLVLFCGPDELAAGVVTIRELASGEQHRVARADLVSEVRRLLAARDPRSATN
uniref:Histidine--tRNA ligase n=1 Tax=Thermorudis peleae TaxID=1382356 RepID=A0A831X1W8_9BACT